MTTAQTEARASLWAPATADQSVSGWTYDFDQIERISRAAYNGTGYDATMEVVRFVMAEADRRYITALAAKDAEIAALKQEAADVVRPFVEYTPDRCFEGNERWKPAVCRDPGGGWYGAEDFRAARSFLDKLEGRDV